MYSLPLMPEWYKPRYAELAVQTPIFAEFAVTSPLKAPVVELMPALAVNNPFGTPTAPSFRTVKSAVCAEFSAPNA
jgi:hypothetical protein